MALPNGIASLSVAHVGAGYLSLTFAFPLLMTYLMALAFGMDRWSLNRMAGVASALGGGLLLALSKLDQAGGLGGGGGAGWVLAASAIPAIIAAGNLYRTRFWPVGAQPILLAGLMLTLGGGLVALAAALREPGEAMRLWHDPALRGLTALNIGVFSVQYVAYFQLQRVAGPVYLSQIGSVAAVVGGAIAALMGERLPGAMPLAAVLFAAGLILFHRSARA